MWILIFTMWLLQSDGSYKSQEFTATFDTIDECRMVGEAKLKEVNEKSPANFFCFHKGEKVD